VRYSISHPVLQTLQHLPCYSTISHVVLESATAFARATAFAVSHLPLPMATAFACATALCYSTPGAQAVADKMCATAPAVRRI